MYNRGTGTLVQLFLLVLFRHDFIWPSGAFPLSTPQFLQLRSTSDQQRGFGIPLRHCTKRQKQRSAEASASILSAGTSQSEKAAQIHRAAFFVSTSILTRLKKLSLLTLGR
jgi:hypothetical protein